MVLAEGADFYASPTLDAAGERLAFVRWNLPDMPWDATELVVRDLANGDETVVAGGADESVVAPQWAPDGSLTFSTDRSNWWNPWRWDPTSAQTTSLATVDAEIGGPLWVFGLRYLAWLPGGRFVCSLTTDGLDRLAVLDRWPQHPDHPRYAVHPHIPGRGRSRRAGDRRRRNRRRRSAPYPGGALGRPDGAPDIERLRPARDLGLGPDPSSWFSVPESLTVPTAEGARPTPLVYVPTNPYVDDTAERRRCWC